MSSSFPFMNQIHDDHENGNYNHPPYGYCYNYNPFDDGLDNQDFIFGHILNSQKQQFLCTNNFGHDEIGVVESSTTNKEETITTTTTKKEIKTNKKMRNWTKKKDRHSKICTSKGPRDRRMRLSLEIARNFFDLQDMLGFDKPSKTVEWLFSKSRNAIKELEEKYFLSKASNNTSLVGKISSLYDDDKEQVPTNRVKQKRRKLKIIDKESRYEARARARARTRAKLIRRLEESKGDFEGIPVGVCEMGDGIEEIGTKGKIFTHCGNYEKILIGNEFEEEEEEEVISKEKCCVELHLPAGSSSTVVLDTMKASPAGLKLLELDEIDHVMIFCGE